MRHQKSGRHLNRTSAHRKAMLSNMSASLIEHETIKTTVVKAKELRRFVEPLITLSKTDSVANRRRAFAKLRNKAAVGKLFTELGPRYIDRPGGYTRILKAGYRQGDSAMVAYMQLMDQPEQTVEQAPEPLLPAAAAAEEDEASAITDETTNDSETTESLEVTDEVEETEVQAEAATEEVSESSESDAAETSASDEESTADQAEDKKKD